MKIALDIQSAVTQRAGVGRYTRELATHLLPLLDQDTQLRLDYFDFRRAATVPQELQNHPGLHPVHWAPGALLQKMWNHLPFPCYEHVHGSADLYHFPNFLLPPKKTGKALVTIHDLAFMRYPQYTEPRNLDNLKRGITRTAQAADGIITVSHFSAGEISTFLDVAPEKVFPIHLGVGSEFKRPTDKCIEQFRTRSGIYRPFLLTVGTVEPRKNINFLVKLFETLEDYDGDLIIAGGLGWHYMPILEQLRTSTRAPHIRRIGFVADEDLPALYASADLFLVPSFYEGFGFPPLEAMACETPVIASTGGSLKEVLQDGAILHDHYNLDIWKESVFDILADKKRRACLTEHGLQVARQYNWEKTAQNTLDVYRNLLT